MVPEPEYIRGRDVEVGIADVGRAEGWAIERRNEELVWRRGREDWKLVHFL